MHLSEIRDLMIAEDTPLRDVIRTIDRSGRVSMALLTGSEGRLLATITDGDVRRGIMAGFGLDSPLRDILPIKQRMPNPRPITASVGSDRATLLKIMTDRSVRQLPLLDTEGRVQDIIILADLLPHAVPGMKAVIMAGGFGKRLRPLTEDLPKPMLPVGGRPLMEKVVEQLRDAGIHQIVVSTHYKAEKIMDHFGDGRDFDVRIDYVREDQPLGTGGALSLVARPQEPMLVINGDILTQVDFHALLAYHQEHVADLTVAVRHYGMQVPYGVVDCDGSIVTGISEKPTLSFFVNAGIYLLAPQVFEFVNRDQAFNMTDLIGWLNKAGKTVVSFPILEYWLDIGQPEDFQRAQEDVRNDPRASARKYAEVKPAVDERTGEK
jgi:dTDP-glucose pyrophosphorylase/CBS domain-containing protein